MHQVGIIHDSFNFKLCKAIQQGRFDPLATQFCSVIDLQSLLYSLSISVTHLLLMCVHVLQIREEIKQFGINIYQFPECDSDEDEDFKTQEQILKVPHFIHVVMVEMCCLVYFKADGLFWFGLFFFVVVVVVVVFLQNSIPFAVIGSNVQVESKGRKFRGRVYPWGVVEGITPSLLILILL